MLSDVQMTIENCAYCSGRVCNMVGSSVAHEYVLEFASLSSEAAERLCSESAYSSTNANVGEVWDQDSLSHTDQTTMNSNQYQQIVLTF